MVLTSVTVTLLISRELVLSLEVAAVLNAVNLCVYYGYERMWTTVGWGIE